MMEENKAGREVAGAKDKVLLLCGGWSGKASPKGARPGKRGGHVGAWEKNGPRGVSLRWEQFLGLRNSREARAARGE